MPVTVREGALPSFTSFNQMDWNPYLKSICCDSRYGLVRECFTPLDVLDRRTERFLLDLQVRTAREATAEAKERQEQKVERWDVLDGLRRHAAEHVLLVGRPGSGKSTALQRLLLEEAERAMDDAEARIPVLLELRHYQKSTLDSLSEVLDEFVEPQHLPGWLRQGRLLLLMDGINELPSDAARSDLVKFRKKYRTTTPMIFATRELMAGGDLEIGKRLEMEPLTEPQMQQFVRAYLGEDGDKLLRQLQGRLRELAEVPLLLWMLCSLFQETRERLPENLGLALRQFTALYDRQLKGDAPVSGESRRWWPRLLQQLAFKMLEGPEPTGLHVAIPRSQAEDWLTAYLREEQCSDPRNRAMEWLKDLVNHHLLQRSAGDRIEFRHQFIQEYYAAEYLLSRLPKLDDVALQRDYLNYLKWTEPFILLLGLLENRKQALRIVKLAEAVDWPLAARLAGAVHPDWQKEAIRFIAITPQIPEWHRMKLYGLTRSCGAIQALERALLYEDIFVRGWAVFALGDIGGMAAADLLCTALYDDFDGVRLIASQMLRSMGDANTVSPLSAALRDRSAEVRIAAVWALGGIDGETTVELLRTVLCDDPMAKVRKAAVWALRGIGSDVAIDILHTALRDNVAKVRKAAILALNDINSETAVDLLQDNANRVDDTDALALREISNTVAFDIRVNALRNGSWNAAFDLRKTGNASLLAELAPNSRQDIETAMAVYSVIKTLQQRFKIYRADAFWPQSTELQPSPAEISMHTLRVVLASPSDVQPERYVLPGVVEELNRGMGALIGVDLKLYRWETDAYPGFHPEGPQGLIDGVLRIDE